MNGKPWTKEQLALLRKEYATTPKEDLERVFGHSEQSVETMARRYLNLKKLPFWTKEKIKLLRLVYPDSTLREMEPLFGITNSAVCAMGKSLGLKKSKRYAERIKKIELETQARARAIRGCHVWTSEEETYLRKHYPMTLAGKIAKTLKLTLSQIHGEANRLGIHKHPDFNRLVNGKRLLESGKSHRFKKGQLSWNKGMKGIIFPGSEKGWFKKGHLPKNTQHDGAISIRIDLNQETGVRRRYKHIRVSKAKWKMLHVVVWEKHHGPVPEGSIVVFKNGDTMNCEISNLECITREQHMLNTQLKDESIAMRLAGTRRPNSELARALLQQPALIEAKRQQLTLSRQLKEATCRAND